MTQTTLGQSIVMEAEAAGGSMDSNGKAEAYKFESWMQPIFNADGNYVHFWDGHMEILSCLQLI